MAHIGNSVLRKLKREDCLKSEATVCYKSKNLVIEERSQGHPIFDETDSEIKG